MTLEQLQEEYDDMLDRLRAEGLHVAPRASQIARTVLSFVPAHQRATLLSDVERRLREDACPANSP